MASFSKGTSFTDGVTGDVTAAKLHALVDAATPVAGLVTDRTAKTSVAGADLVLLSDSADSNNLKKVSVTNFANNLPTAVITNGTVTTLNSTAATITTGTIPTLVSTTLVTTGTGTAAAPAIVPTGDTNTGIFFPAADTIAFGEGGTEAMRIDSSGNVEVKTAGAKIKLARASDASLVGEIGSQSGTGISIKNIGGTTSEVLIGSDWVAANTNGTERLRIDSSGNLLVGKTSTGNTTQGVTIGQDGTISLTVRDAGGASQAIFINRQDSTGTAVLFRQANSSVGSISVTASATAYNTSSDYRLKTNLNPILDGIIRLKQLPVYRFNWLSDIDGNKVDGFVAHEAQAVVPECVTGEKDAVDADGNPIYQGIDQSKIVPLLTAALKEAISEIETLKFKVAALEAA